MIPPLLLAAHGSADPRFADVVTALAKLVSAERPDLEVRIGYLDHGPPDLAAVAEAGCIVVPVLLTSGYHARTDIPEQAPGCVVTPPIGPDRRITLALAARLREAGWKRENPLLLAGAGSSDPRALADVHQMAGELGDELGLAVAAAFLSDGEPRLADVPAAAVSTYLLAPGKFADLVTATATAGGASIIAAPIGADPLLAEIILDRYDTAR